MFSQNETKDVPGKWDVWVMSRDIHSPIFTIYKMDGLTDERTDG